MKLVGIEPRPAPDDSVVPFMYQIAISPDVSRHRMSLIPLPSKSPVSATDHTVEEMARILGADSLAYISIENLKEAIGADGGFCDACFTGNYPTPVPASVTLRRPEPVGVTAHQGALPGV